MNISYRISQLIDYAVNCNLIEDADRVYMTNVIMRELGISSGNMTECCDIAPLCEILESLSAYALEEGIIGADSIAERDLFDTKLMGILTPRPSEVICRFREAYNTSPKAATDYFYSLAVNSNYIRRDRVARDIKWRHSSEFGELEVSVNLSKPEKDPLDIARAGQKLYTEYPLCALCRENEGYAGSLIAPARQNLRMIPIKLGGEEYFFQYSPYVYYNEHCILLSREHRPMSIGRETFERLFDFLDIFPHYFIGSNSELPIVGGSIISHDHFQGGRYSFPMERANIEMPLCFLGYRRVRAGIVKWPMSVIRLASDDRGELSELCEKILLAWRDYEDADVLVFPNSDGDPHNTITPIARIRGGRYEIDLVLRNNKCTAEHPFGLYHPHVDKHNIKKENIGLIEAMGLAVLPSRLARETELMKKYILSGKDFSENEHIAKHKAWYERFSGKYDFSESNTEEILRCEIGKTYLDILSDAGVFKRTGEGRTAFLKFIDNVNRK
ncbi:MAG: UDP-glucose--hexose-1-phosphate uridylyltransferase [Clostridia bacterium]|nr:UDP-glucose--hexose-1-phosphate uridylyltransferase [Clostridia bacterium]